jgi:alkylation response protein AidB-like acyl-CoA dehydrogenase
MSQHGVPTPYSEGHEIFRNTVRSFLARELTPHVEEWEEDRVPDRSFWSKAGAAGILGAGLPEEYGGPGGDFLHHVIVAEELGSCIGGASVGVALQSDLPAFHILNFGTEEQKRRWLPKIVSGEAVTTVAMTEPNTGSDLAAIRTSAVRDGDDYVVNGSKVYISGGQVADLAVLAVKTDASKGSKGISLLLLDMTTPGLRRGRNLKKMGMKAGDNVELFFDDMRVPVSCLLGQEGQGFAILMSELPRERLVIAARALAEAQLAYDLTVDYVKQREAFGKKIIEFQNTGFTMATMKAELAVGRAYLNESLLLAAQGILDNTRSAIAKLWITEMQGRVVDQCVQLHGGAGYMDEYPVSKLFTSARITRIFGGTSEIMRLSIARTI